MLNLIRKNNQLIIQHTNSKTQYTNTKQPNVTSPLYKATFLQHQKIKKVGNYQNFKRNDFY